MSGEEDYAKLSTINQKNANSVNNSQETNYKSMAGTGCVKIEKPETVENKRSDDLYFEKIVKRQNRRTISKCFQTFLKGPKRNGPILVYSLESMIYLFRDLIWMFFLFFPIFIKTIIDTFSAKNEKDLKDKVVVVTGAGNGLGKEMARQFARKGCKVACVDIQEECNKRTQISISYAMGNEDVVKAYTCDVSKAEETKKLSEKILKDFKQVDILVNNAGIIYGNTLTGGTDAMIKRVMDVNFMAGFWMVRAFLPDMMKRKSGHIVFINSGSGVNPIQNASAYVSAKFALTGLAYAMQEEIRCNQEVYGNIKVTSVHPYFIKTHPEYVKRWRLRLPPMELKEAASQIIKGIRREYQNFAVPALDMGYWLTSSIRYFPRQFYNIILDTFYVDVATDVPEPSLSAANAKPKEL